MKAVGFISILGTVLVFFCGVQTASAGTNTVPGWTVLNLTKQGQDVETCVATWNNDEPNYGITIEALGALLTLTVSSPNFDQEKHEEIVTLAKTGIGKLRRPARVADRAYSITIDDEVDDLLEKEGPLILTVKGKDYSFSLANIPLAIDAILHCVGEPSRADLAARHEPSFSLPNGWESLDVAAGCAARLKGDEVDTWITINNNDQVLLMAGHKTWNFWGQKIDLTLQIDAQAPLSLGGWEWGNLVLVLLPDDRDVTALRKASALRWHFPTGDYSTKVHDVGSALDAAAACTKEKRITTPH